VMNKDNLKGWREYRLGEVAEITSAKRIYYSEYVPNGVPFFRSKEIIERFNKQNTSTELFIKRERYEEIKRKFGAPQEGDILLTSVGTLGIPYIVRGEDEFYFKDGNLIWFRNINSKTINKSFLYFWITSAVGQQKLDEASIGSTQPALTIIGLKNVDIFLPPLPEQHAISSVLSSLDDKIDLLHRQNKTLESMAEALWQKMFIEDADPGWQKGKLEDIADINPLRSIKKGTFATYLDMANMPTDGPFPNYLVKREFTSGIKFRNGDTIIARITPCLENGKTSYVNFLDEGEIGWGSTEYIVLSAKTGFCSEWNYFLARNDDFRDYAILNMTGTSGRQRVSGDTIAQYEVAIPAMDVIDNFRTFASPVMNHIKYNSIQIRTLSRLRDTLLPKLMSGEVRVKLN
jgi:type I restriction enzyme S subunit